jgi:hypothetical protein
MSEQSTNKKFLKDLYHLTGYTAMDIKFTEESGRKYIVLDEYISAVITSSRRPDLSKILKYEPLRTYNDVKDVWFRSPRYKDVGINQVKLSKRNADKPIKNSWCVTFLDPLIDGRICLMHVEGRKYFSITRNSH